MRAGVWQPPFSPHMTHTGVPEVWILVLEFASCLSQACPFSKAFVVAELWEYFWLHLFKWISSERVLARGKGVVKLVLVGNCQCFVKNKCLYGLD